LTLGYGDISLYNMPKGKDFSYGLILDWLWVGAGIFAIYGRPITSLRSVTPTSLWNNYQEGGINGGKGPHLKKRLWVCL